jgi:hypothetical protein
VSFLPPTKLKHRKTESTLFFFFSDGKLAFLHFSPHKTPGPKGQSPPAHLTKSVETHISTGPIIISVSHIIASSLHARAASQLQWWIHVDAPQCFHKQHSDANLLTRSFGIPRIKGHGWCSVSGGPEETTTVCGLEKQ